MTVCVLGSVNLDHVVRAPRIPGPGETLVGTDVAEHPGGKGANQATGAGRSGARTVFIGALGEDAAAARLLAGLRGAGVGTHTRTVPVATGTAWITVADDGENVIVVVPGANATITELTPAERQIVAGSRVLLLQQEIPESALLDATTVATAAGGLVLLNAAPSRAVSPDLLARVGVLIVNEHEAADLTGVALEPGEAVRLLLKRVPAVVLTLGAAGSLIAVRGHDPVGVPAHAVPAVDTTGAGDAFCGALAAELDRSPGEFGRAPGELLETLVAAARFATSVSALAVQRPGAASSIPTRAEVLKAFPA